ncbi:MAG: dihydropteroate synthase [Syntrophobacter sp.]
MLIIGERINSSRKSIAQAMSSGDRDFIQNEARMQAEAGAHYLDVNAGALVSEETDKLKWAIDAVQEISDLPLCIDTPDAEVMKAVLPLVKVPPMINSITLEPGRLEGILPLVAQYGAKVIALCQSENMIADTTEAKVELAGRLVEQVQSAGVALDDLYIDPLVYPVGTDSASATATLAAIERIMKEFPGVHTTCGLTNVSHGLPARKLVNRTFLVACIARGLDSAIMDPTDKLLYSAMRAAVMVAGRDEFCMEYIQAFRAGRLE